MQCHYFAPLTLDYGRCRKCKGVLPIQCWHFCRPSLLSAPKCCLQDKLPPACVLITLSYPLVLSSFAIEGTLLQAAQLQGEARPQLLQPCHHRILWPPFLFLKYVAMVPAGRMTLLRSPQNIKLTLVQNRALHACAKLEIYAPCNCCRWALWSGRWQKLWTIIIGLQRPVLMSWISVKEQLHTCFWRHLRRTRMSCTALFWRKTALMKERQHSNMRFLGA